MDIETNNLAWYILRYNRIVQSMDAVVDSDKEWAAKVKETNRLKKIIDRQISLLYNVTHDT